MDTGLFSYVWLFVAVWQQEYLFMPKLMIAKNRKGNNMNYGLLVMYIFLALISCWYFHLFKMGG